MDWFDDDLSASFLLDLESGPSDLVESMLCLCQERGWMTELRDLAERWLVGEALQRFKALLSKHAGVTDLNLWSMQKALGSPRGQTA